MAVGTVTALMLGFGLGGQVLNFFAQRSATNAAKESAEFNAKVAEMQAVDALARGADDEERFREVVKGLIGSQRAGFAGQNVDVGIGSPVDVVADTAYLGELDALTIRNNAAREAWGYEIEAENFRRFGANAARQGRFNQAGALFGIGTSVLGAFRAFGIGSGGNTSPSRSIFVSSPGAMPFTGIPSVNLGPPPLRGFG